MSSAQHFVFCSVDDLKKNKSVTKWIEEIKDELIAIIDQDEIKVMSSVCPHFGGAFTYHCAKKELVCNWHGFTFDTESGKCTFPYNKMKLRQYSHQVVNGNLEIQLP
jgi:nitrite reductase/ring-hydroxylating ferredoxin subunit